MGDKKFRDTLDEMIFYLNLMYILQSKEFANIYPTIVIQSSLLLTCNEVLAKPNTLELPIKRSITESTKLIKKWNSKGKECVDI
ncbi:unnamed protein product [Candida verbasci]|uniref:Uncharacterized protein n=1 Tax=Candida verbasci TaxID=1227364 RepID=A0A9W4TTQ3_9ASCO|nr:unnamed protein product [Candida verbasci]